jgi:hypothetical protein
VPMDAVLSFAIGVASAVVTVMLLQTWPTRFRFASRVERSRGDRTGRRIYRVKLYRPQRPGARLLRRPFDVTFHARVVLDPRRSEKVVEIPVGKDWRPRIAGAVMTDLLPFACDPRELRPFPTDVQEKRRTGTLTIDHLLAVPNTVLRVYAFMHRPYSGTRLVVFREYDADAVQSGHFARRDNFEPSPEPPTRTERDLPQRLPRDSTHRRLFSLTAGRLTLTLDRTPDPPASKQP